MYLKKLQIVDFESFMFWSKFNLSGLLVDVLASDFFSIFSCRPTMLAHTFTQCPHL